MGDQLPSVPFISTDCFVCVCMECFCFRLFFGGGRLFLFPSLNEKDQRNIGSHFKLPSFMHSSLLLFLLLLSVCSSLVPFFYSFVLLFPSLSFHPFILLPCVGPVLSRRCSNVLQSPNTCAGTTDHSFSPRLFPLFFFASFTSSILPSPFRSSVASVLACPAVAKH